MNVIDANGKPVSLNFLNVFVCCIHSLFHWHESLMNRFVACICIGDANGKMMLAHAASAQGISGDHLVFFHLSTAWHYSFSFNISLKPEFSFLDIVIEQISGKNNVLNHLSIPAACFTHPEISMVGLIEVIFCALPTLLNHSGYTFPPSFFLQPCCVLYENHVASNA